MKKATFAKILFSLLIVGAVSAFSHSASIPELFHRHSDADEYVCPPCGCASDGKDFNEAGSCPSCGMNLVLKGSGASLPHDHPPADSLPKVAILIFNGVQIIDYTGPYEVFGQAGFNVFTIAARPEMIVTSMGMKVTPSYTFETAPRPDVLVIPGGNGVVNAQEDQQTIQWVQEKSKDARHVLSVCNGAYILARAGLLDGLSATTFYDLIDGLKTVAPKTRVVRDQRYVDNGKIITTAGISSGIDGSLYLVSKMRSKAAAQMAALNMEYNYQPTSAYARGNFADRHLRNIFSRRLIFAMPEGVRLRVLSTEGDANRWELVWQIEGEIKEADALKLIGEQLSKVGKWQLMGTEKNRSRWQFKDDAGEAWRGEASVESGKQATIRVYRTAV